MNREEADQALAIANELGFEVSIQETGDDATFRLMTFDPFDKSLFHTSFAAFVERYGTIETIRAQAAAAEANLEMDQETADRLSDAMLELSARFRGLRVAPSSALPDTPGRVFAALLMAAEASNKPSRSRELMLALVDLGAFVDDADVEFLGTPAGEETRRSIVQAAQADAIVAFTGVRAWRADEGLPARIGAAEAAVRAAISSQAGYDASGAVAMIGWVVVTFVVGAGTLIVALVAGTTPWAVVVGVVSSLVAAFPILAWASRAASKRAADAALEGDTTRGRRAERVMSLIGALPLLGPVAVSVMAYAVAAVVL